MSAWSHRPTPGVVVLALAVLSFASGLSFATGAEDVASHAPDVVAPAELAPDVPAAFRLEAKTAGERVERRSGFRAHADGWVSFFATSGTTGLRLEVFEEGGVEPIAADGGDEARASPQAWVEVTRGRELEIRLSAVVPAAAVAGELKAVTCRETAATRAAAARLRAAVDEAARQGDEGNLEAAREVLREAHEGARTVEGADGSRGVKQGEWALGLSAYGLGELELASDAWHGVLEFRSRTLPDDHSDLQFARLHYALTLEALGDLAGAKELEWKVLEVRSRTLPDDHPDLQSARLNYAATLAAFDDLSGAKELFAKVLEVFSRTLPDDHPDLQTARLNYALTLGMLGDLAGAKELESKVLEVLSRTLPDDHPNLQAARLNYALTLGTLGDLAGAKELESKVLEVYSRTLPDDHPDLQRARLDHAATLMALGDLAAAKELESKVLEVFSRTLPNDHPSLQAVRLNYALTLGTLGDLSGAKELESQVLEVYSRTLPDDHPDLQSARLNYAVTLAAFGDRASAKELESKVLEVYSRTLPDDHPSLQWARINYAGTLGALGDLAGAKELFAKVLEVFSRTLPDDHPDLQSARLNHAVTLAAFGDLVGAKELESKVLEVYSRTLPDDHPSLHSARGNYAWTLARLGEDEALAIVLASLARGVRTALLHVERDLAPRAATESAAALDERVSTLLSLYDRGAAFRRELGGEIFSVVETARSLDLSLPALGRAASAAPPEDRAEIDALRAEIAMASAALAAATNAGSFGSEGQRPTAEALRRRFEDARKRKEDAERNLLLTLQSLPGVAALLEPATVESVASALAGDERAVGYRRYMRSVPKADPAQETESVASYCAFVVDPSGTVAFVDLGPAAEIERAVETWVQLASDPNAPRASAAILQRRSSRVRELVLDPVLKVAGEPRRVFVALDDALWLVPFDALDDGAGGFLGDRLEIAVVPRLRGLGRNASSEQHSPSLLAAGGIDYSAAAPSPDLVTPKKPDGALALRGPDRAGDVVLPEELRGAAPWTRRFETLPNTESEARDVVSRFMKHFTEAPAPVLLTGHEASKARLSELAPKVRFLHLATHGWFAPDSIPAMGETSALDAKLGLGRHAGLSERVRGLAPLLLAGVALSGANGTPGEDGVHPGILTAEELSRLDLAGAELVVLSACETGLGVRRAGQGIQSLGVGLHAAGARHVLTSLWRVPDAATARLMAEFYQRIWRRDGTGKRQALREAKKALREAGYPAAAWAGWVLSGEVER